MKRFLGRRLDPLTMTYESYPSEEGTPPYTTEDREKVISWCSTSTPGMSLVELWAIKDKKGKL